MRVLKRNRWLSGLAVLLAGLVVCGGQALADVTTNDTGTVLIFPKVIANGTRDTLIQITNTGNLITAAHCTYVNAVGQCSISQTSCTRIDVGSLGSPDCPALATPGNSGQCALDGSSCTSDTDCEGLGNKCLNLSRESCLNTCSFEHDFDIFLTAQQPTVWRVSTGRPSNPSDQFKGFDPAPGAGVQGVTPDFEGTLRCVETDLTGAITASNKLKGEAVLETLDSGEISEYNAVAIKGNSSPETTIVLDNKSFNACANNLWVNNYADFAPDALFGNATVTTEVTLVPCSEDLEDGIAIQAAADFTFIREDELPGSSRDGVPFNCYFNQTLSDIDFGEPSTATQFNKTKIAPSTDHVCFSGNVGLPCSSDSQCGSIVPGWGCRPRPGLIGIAEEFHHIGSFAGTAAANLHQDGVRVTSPADEIVIQSPACGDIDQPCCSGTGCFNGSCQSSGLCE